ncbi:GNAT family N-acetyltransferase [Thalassotalea hakodatensis]|uniref:GNAT family N-acetyltransferase n=1 Tax=Thalassotalea hakodatensis TaxID=3030492 RepID=UPI0025742ACC|nr:GNAT family protein [Thalassotalea hakodatensis]
MNIELIQQSISLQTTRFDLALMTSDDFNLFQQLQTDPRLMQYIGPILEPQALAEKFSQRIKPWQHEEEHWLTFKITEKSSKSAVGSIGFRIEDLAQQRAEIGYLLLGKHQGKGIIPEVGRCLIEFLFQQIGVHKVIAYCYAKNIGSWKVMEKLGMRKEAHFRAHTLLNNEWHDEFIYALLVNEQKNKH